MNLTSAPRFTDDDEVQFMNVDMTDFASMSRPDQIRHLEVEGYVVFPSILAPDDVARIKRELADSEMTHTNYSVNQTRAVIQPQWHSRAVAELIGYPPMIDFLTDLMGPDIVFTRGFFQRSKPGCPGISMHTDGQPHGSNLFGYEGSCPRLVRVLYYLDELTPQRAPFRLIPRSHLSFHAEASPYVRYKSHPEEITLVVPAGSAVIVPSLLLHGSHPNKDEQPRELVQLGYRPAWAGPIQPIDDWDPALVASAPEIAKPFLKSLNTSSQAWEQEHKPTVMKSEAPGINPSRWGDNFPEKVIRFE
ncbi:MAG: phytanoyl-CoA dioxygenase family protein [Planctomycetota bacterium]|nr:phytanoyl-CoA dioxygenase family protein [Planctomycetota bacterium]MDA1211277.1 phytanoyl-CoA dioxygenase family protein [Planctomycetota bacterium]